MITFARMCLLDILFSNYNLSRKNTFRIYANNVLLISNMLYNGDDDDDDDAFVENTIDRCVW